MTAGNEASMEAGTADAVARINLVQTEAWITAGAPHHTVLSTAVGVEEFGDLAEILDTELLHIDAATTMRSFIKEVRWSQAYYRLAAGF